MAFANMQAAGGTTASRPVSFPGKPMPNERIAIHAVPSAGEHKRHAHYIRVKQDGTEVVYLEEQREIALKSRKQVDGQFVERVFADYGKGRVEVGLNKWGVEVCLSALRAGVHYGHK